MVWFVENQGFKSDFTVTLFFVEVPYLINNNLQIDASISTNFKDTPTVLYGGIDSWRYDGNYKEVRINTGSSDNAK
jgi:hypothetical protein